MSARGCRAAYRRVPSASTLLIGRDRELAKLYAVVDGIEEQGGALVVRGEAGIGKSALLAAAKERALQRGVTVVSTTGALSEAQLAFAGFTSCSFPCSAGSISFPTRSDGHSRRRSGSPRATLPTCS